MKRFITFALLSALLMGFSIQSGFAGPFGIDMGMSFAQVKTVCKTAPVHIQDNVYEITPPKTNDMFETYYVRIDPEYGVYWLKAIGKDVYTNSYGDSLRSTFERLVESIRKSYGEESLIKDELKEGSIWDDPQDFMHALLKEERTLYALWAQTDDPSLLEIRALGNRFSALSDLLSDPDYKDRTLNYMETKDSVALSRLIDEKVSQYKKLPSDIAIIGIFTTAISSSMGYVALEYSFSNEEAVNTKADSVF